MNTIRFNTGRKYTAAGQRIVATLHDEAKTKVASPSGITTEWSTASSHWVTSTPSVPPLCSGATITAHKGTNRAWADGMQRGGCNTDLGGLK